MNSKHFFSYAKNYSCISTGIGPLIDATGKLVTCAKEMAEILSSQYRSVWSELKQKLQEATELFPVEEIMTPGLWDIAFNEDDIMIAIDELSPSAVFGPDKFPAILLENCKELLSQPLHHTWQKSLRLGQYPRYLKLANVISIHKGGSQGSANNCRPVALTSHLSKVFEKVVRKFIVAFLEEHNLFNPTQHGFRLGRSCLSQLIDHYDHITQLLEKRENIDVIYLDFAKAFDKVDFQDILRKIKQLGISGKLGRWIYSSLSGRKQSVTVNGIKSCSVDVKSGVS